MMEGLLTLVIALVGSAGFWSYIQMRNKRASSYQETLKEQVDRLADKLEAYSKDKEELLREIGELRAELAAAHQTIKYLEEFLRRK